MTCTEDLAGLPPFPTDVPTAPLLRLSLDKLLAHDTVEIQRLMQACEKIGLFCLNLQGSEEGISILEDADKLFKIGEQLFDLTLEEKLKYDFSGQNSYYGYKAQGTAIFDRQGNLDRNEFYNVSRDDIMDLTPSLPAPDILHQTRPALQSFIRTSHSIVSLLLDLLNGSLNLPPSTITDLHRLNAISGDQVRFINAPLQPANDRRTVLGEHTDLGSITILFSRLGGLQVLPPGADAQWVYVRPLPGHAIVNLGDAMIKFTNGLFRSNIHRVASSPGQLHRYSLVYFSRPQGDVILRRLKGSGRIPELKEGDVEEAINSKDWIIRRALDLRANLKEIDFEKSAGTEQLSRRIKV
ncbi:LOW QUALITY PROTEIN: putative oxidoreductase, 2OG-Fe(II) oxygenase family [Aspergillus clavatus NRRL 1]|uniref:Oxidoreductase, 2OG-Fe(II) oxygenase family, putative n=1 Tax=Aspergillus clavatus (strain ATCC 1007 / CBS 513.65 / DSM 816 / NCTC 3887 / NRRL 1 / QM 1276 / 107) TaxID=344612 RepID=A1CB66_ASPCL|nr:LOW QUALITY PROTEIN: oxidoreductase, 2OG-Fe(II) oxygenase family, putative [Aspergillus clavatus NRRL 1]EAW12984.1 oxidoreductase, 2OG-Fe(II) oxygenase family, putative [Aspergillus clavatus NRRL 1]